jgi:hypothetical protein
MEDNFKTLLERFGEKNPTFVRIVMESHFTEHEVLKTSQGKIIEWKYKVNSKITP